MKYYFDAFRNYANFSGRSRRSAYWYFTLFHLLAVVLLTFTDIALGMSAEGYGVLTTLYILGTIIPSLSLTVRRLHDTGRSGWYILIGLIPIIGSIILFVFYVENSQPGSNQYGPHPKQLENDQAYIQPI
ncbi:MAG: DUF805 domain-containing protein [Cyclobacteriaceae bacterium]